MKRIADLFLRAILTGFAIAIGGAVNLSCDNKYMGAFLFGLGLFMVLFFGFNLFTGKVGYAVENKPSYLIDLMIIWLGNLAGTVITGLLLLLTRASDAMRTKAAEICAVKLNDSPLSIFILAFFCGILMFVAADGFKKISNPFGQVAVIILPVMVFILSGYEHCVANMFYYTIGEVWSLDSFWYLIIMTLGNSAGGIFIPLIRKGFIKEQKQS